MFGRRKEASNVQRGRRDNDLSKYGLFNIPGAAAAGLEAEGAAEEEDEAALEAELLALTAGAAPAPPRRKAAPVKPVVNLDAMVAASLQDVPSDDDMSITDDDDPSLLNELHDLVNDDDDDVVIEEKDTTASDASNQNILHGGKKSSEGDMISFLQDRLKMYEDAEKNATKNGETMRARRFTRGIKTLKDMMKQASAGRVINEEDIPPPVVVSGAQKPSSEGLSPAAAAPTRPAPPPPPKKPLLEEPPDAHEEITTEAESEDPFADTAMATDPHVLETLLQKQNEYKQAALKAKKNGSTEEALQFVKVVKQFQPMIEAAKAGMPVDLSSLPPPPQEYNSAPLQGSTKEESEQQKSGFESVGEQEKDSANKPSSNDEQGENSLVDETLFTGPPAPTTVLEALEQRLEKYRSCEEAAKKEGNSSKVRRMGRIVKQYEGAIKMHKAGKPIPVDELPTPPGFGPIPTEGTAAPTASVPQDQPEEPHVPDVSRPLPADPKPLVPKSEGQLTPAPSGTPESGQKEGSVKANVRKSPQSRQEKQLTLLIIRQKKFKDAAIEAKRKGEINQAKEYLRLAKGFDPLIEASQNGLPVDLTSLPIAPENKIELESDFEIVSLEDCIPGTDSEIYEKLEQDLERQTKMCLTTRDHFKATGDIASANRFEQLAVNSKKDLDAVKCAHRRGDPVPKFHYETRTFNIVQCCTDLNDNDLELSVLQGINYNVPNPKDVDTYVKFEFPYPTEAPAKDRTSLVKDTNNPQYNQTFMLAIQRNVRACQRIFKRQSVKLEVWSRGGFFRGDSLIGTAAVKLMPLETRCSVHDAFDLMDGRRAVGGKLEVKIRIRNPILTKQVEKVQEKWLVIDKYL